MEWATTKAEVRAAVRARRAEGQRIALVPTMGYLHEGHLRLVDRARELADWVAMSIFVNPLQFGPAEDFARYPRDLERDRRLAEARGVDFVFAPPAEEMYPRGQPWVTVVPERGADVLCGASRPGHFRGVLTVVAKLFHLFEPDVAVFGRKDFQQAVLIRRMVEDLDFPVRIEVVDTVREADGLALSSRNVYLAPDERGQAAALPRALARARALFAAGESDPVTVVEAARRVLYKAGLAPEYVAIVDPATLEPVARVRVGDVLAIAVRVGSARLIDNTVFGREDPLPE